MIAVAVLATMAVLVWLTTTYLLSREPEKIDSIAVLPFDNESPDKADEYLGAQMAEELSSALAKIPELRVLGRDSAASLKKSKDRRAVARGRWNLELGGGAEATKGANTLESAGGDAFGGSCNPRPEPRMHPMGAMTIR